MPDWDCNLLEDFNEGRELDFEGDKQLILRPDSSSTSSSSDSEEIYLSDRATERDLDLQLEGISSLLDDSEPLGDNNQHVLAQKEKLVHLLCPSN